MARSTIHLTTAQLAERWGCSVSAIGDRWRAGKIPPPFNRDQQRGWRWHVDVIEAYEHGEWQPAGRPPRLVGVA